MTSAPPDQPPSVTDFESILVRLPGAAVATAGEARRMHEDLRAFVALLAGYRRANVTGARGSDQAVTGLVGDALALLEIAELSSEESRAGEAPWADLGSGGGLPGIPLALVLPGRRLTLIEAVGKKCVFLRDVVAELGLTGRVDVACARSEELAASGRPERESYGVVLAKAVGSLAVVVELAAPLLRVGGLLVVSKTAAAPPRRPHELASARLGRGRLRKGRRHAGALSAATGHRGQATSRLTRARGRLRAVGRDAGRRLVALRRGR
jgi:16S rRNA (guanine(527)-N(7))-methyltransferase RsmG